MSRQELALLSAKGNGDKERHRQRYRDETNQATQCGAIQFHGIFSEERVVEMNRAQVNRRQDTAKVNIRNHYLCVPMKLFAEKALGTDYPLESEWIQYAIRRIVRHSTTRSSHVNS